MKKLLVLAMCLGMLLAMPLTAGATQIENDPSPDNPYDVDDGDDDTHTDVDEDPTVDPGKGSDSNNGGGDEDQYNKGDDPDDVTTDETTTTDPNKADPNKAPKTGDTSKAGADAGVVVIAGGVAYFAGRRLIRA